MMTENLHTSACVIYPVSPFVFDTSAGGRTSLALLLSSFETSPVDARLGSGFGLIFLLLLFGQKIFVKIGNNSMVLPGRTYTKTRRFHRAPPPATTVGVSQVDHATSGLRGGR